MTQSVETAYKTEYDKLFIGGKWVQPSTSDVIEVFSPATGEKVGQVPVAAEADVDAACAAARKAFDEGPWPSTPPEERAAVIGRVAKLLEDRADLFKHLLKLETGQPGVIVDMMQYGAALSTLQFYAGSADKFTWSDIRDGVYGQTLVRREPVGVVGAIVAWNVPLFLAANKLGPALVAGCTVVLKPAAETPLSTNALAEVFAEAGLPEGSPSPAAPRSAGRSASWPPRSSRHARWSWAASPRPSCSRTPTWMPRCRCWRSPV
jgi:acyl-CoA reductase-like NAD-dependent aldehyde dehydrogenase